MMQVEGLWAALPQYTPISLLSVTDYWVRDLDELI